MWMKLCGKISELCAASSGYGGCWLVDLLHTLLIKANHLVVRHIIIKIITLAFKLNDKPRHFIAKLNLKVPKQ
jgi:hypothetical protein